jgi:hypothetical protein
MLPETINPVFRVGAKKVWKQNKKESKKYNAK